MRPDKIVARILLVFSVANVALAAPAVARQRYLDVAKAASKKRAPGSNTGITGGEVMASPSSATPLRPAAGEQDSASLSKWFAYAHPGPPEGGEPAWSPARTTGLNTGITGSEIELGAPSGTSSLRPAGEQDPVSKWLAGAHPGPPEGAEPAWTSLYPSKANKFISGSLKTKLLISSGVVALVAGAAGAAYGIHQWIKKRPYVSPLLRTSNRVTNILTCDLPQ
jgi:hypothetical protein